MDKVDKLEQFAQARFELAVAKKNLKERIDSDLYVAHNGGMFKADQGLISFLNAWEEDTIYMVDTYENPIQVQRTTLLEYAKQSYQQKINAYHVEYEQLKQTRRATQV